MSALDSIKDFVEGRLDAITFREYLYKDAEFEKVLMDDPTLESTNYVSSFGNVYLFVLEQDLDDLCGVLNAHGALCEYLDRRGVRYERSEKYSEIHDILLDAQPGWLDVDLGYVAKSILPNAGNLKGRALREWLTSQFLERFKYVEKTPDWIQSPAWPIRDGRPLVFLGQLTLSDYFHDEAAVYVFHDPVSGTCETVIQVA
jgi:hypothetical protein